MTGDAPRTALNRYEQFTTELDGLPIHFLQVRSPQDDALPLVMTPWLAGFDHRVLEGDRAVDGPGRPRGRPSGRLPPRVPLAAGIRFQRQARGAWVGRAADRLGAWAQLMARLGYSRYGAQGGDWGSAVTMALAGVDAEHLAGIHVNMALADPKALGGLGELTEGEQAALASFAHYAQWDAGYSTQQSTRPQTVGYGLVDSPAALCGWIVEKFWSWMDCDGRPRERAHP